MASQRWARAFALCAVVWPASGRDVSITEYGAVPFKATTKHALANGVALWATLGNASRGDVVVVPAGSEWYMVPHAPLYGLDGVSLRIDGALVGYDDPDIWPHGPSTYTAMVAVYDSVDLKIFGAGAVDGQGLAWWWRFSLAQLDYKRPMLLQLENCTRVEVSGLALLDSPRFNVYLGSYTRTAVVRGVTILTDWEAQAALHTQARMRNLPMFPFNTDGIDLAGSDVLIEDCVISNWDDVIAVKPSAAALGCTNSVRVRNLTVYRGVGISVGSVHAAADQPCVRDVVFSDIQLFSPLKGIYIKPDLGRDACDVEDAPACSAVIADVTYENITMTQGTSPHGWDDTEANARQRADPSGARAKTKTAARRTLDAAVAAAAAAETAESQRLGGGGAYECSPLDYFCMMWPVYIGPQQQLEPDGSGSGIWARTEPRVTVANITLRNVTAQGGVWPMSAGVLRCNASNPCTNVSFVDVDLRADVFTTGSKWICDDEIAAFGSANGHMQPDVSKCLST
ncbi:pectin lyase fold/virulence factor [Pelagophyceae sp. CCMP2097]|nr:pectin lyase fold/virulence factor [Pelagophyceae sp. CCMP2097]